MSTTTFDIAIDGVYRYDRTYDQMVDIITRQPAAKRSSVLVHCYEKRNGGRVKVSVNSAARILSLLDARFK